MMYGFGYGGEWFGHTLFGGFFMLIVWAAVILFFIWLLREFSRGNRGEEKGYRGKDALEMLKERYAKGEIDKKEFEEKKRDIE